MIFITILISLLALSLGSFANSLIWRLANEKSFKGRSICPQCQKLIMWYDNIPLISFILLKGKCRYCQKKISWQYPIVELSLMLLFLLAWFRFLDFQLLNFEQILILIKSEAIWMLIRDFLALFLLIIILVFDWCYLLVPVNLLIISLPIFWLISILMGVVWWWPLLLSFGVALFFLLQYLITKKRGLGEGDIWLGAWLAFLLPIWSHLLVAILIAYLLGSLIGIILIVIKKKKWQSKLPLGVFLVIGTILAIFWGDLIYFSYWNFFL